jgi:hypothetical protein
MPLQSEFKKNSQLVACAERDPAHVGRYFNAKGEHVKLIKKALNVWLDRENLNPKPAKLDETTDVYDDKVAKLVYRYKSIKGILNYRGQIDDIVGIKTVDALDKELPIELDPIDVESNFMDVVVKFQGALTDAPKPLTEDEVIPFGTLFAYMVNKIVPKTRKLVRVGHQTTGFGSATKSIRTGIMDKIHAELGDDFSFGHVFVFGSSSGGRNAIEFTNEFAAKGGSVRYLAVADPAFFPQDTETVPDQVPEPTNAPVFKKVIASAREKKNFFQIAGNLSEKRTFSSQTIFVSLMDNKEIHGEIEGFTPVDQTSEVKRAVVGGSGKKRADDLHIQCSKLALPKIHRDIATVLNGLP